MTEVAARAAVMSTVGGRPVLVTGANGTVGSSLLGLLSGQGRHVIAGVTDPTRFGGEQESRGVNFQRPETFGAALDGVGQVFLMRPPAISDTKRYLRPFIEAARRHHVKHVVFLSVMGVNRLLPHWQVEQDLKASGIPTTVLRPSYFAQNLQTAYLHQIRDENRLVASSGSGRTSFIDTRDIAAVAAMVFDDPGPHTGRVYTLTGPAALDFYHVAAMLSAELRRPINYEPQRLLAYRHTLRQAQLPASYVNVQLVINAVARLGLAGKLTDTVPELLGRPALALPEYLHDHRDVWRPLQTPNAPSSPGHAGRPTAARPGGEQEAGSAGARETRLSDVLSEFARTLVTDFPIQGILDHLVRRIVDVLPITSAGVTLISGNGGAPHYIACSDEDALRFERLQTELAQGPCLAAYATGDAVAIPDLASDHRFPVFAPRALAAGMGAVFTFPLRHDGGRLGALDLYRDSAGALDAADMAAAQTLADVTVAYLLNAQAREAAQAASDHFLRSSLHDSLTGLPNRSLLAQRLDHAARRAARSHTTAAVLFVDLDGFKQVNDSHGHQVGDDLLVAVAHRLAALVRPGDTLARVGGDEFVFLCEDLNTEADADLLAHRVDEAFLGPFLTERAKLSITASVGVAFAGPGEAVSDRLVIEADTAMYQAKRNGGASHQILDLRQAHAETQQRRLLADLRVALVEHRLDVAYQPIVRVSDGRIVKVEALVRWDDPQRGPVPATVVVRLAEQSGLIGELGTQVLARSCRDWAGWAAQSPNSLVDLAVNVSARQLLSPDIVSAVTTALHDSGIPADRLVLEMTEYLLLEDSDRAMTVLHDLKELGVRLALDDFGTGYSSLSYLRRLPIDIVKIDRHFVADLDRSSAGRQIVAAVTNLSHVLGLTLTAEGVETLDQHDAVAALGCECAQGFLYSHPVPASVIAELLQDPVATLLPDRDAPTASLRTPAERSATAPHN